MYVVIRQMCPSLNGYTVDKDKLKKFLKGIKEKGIEIFIYEDGKLIKKIKK